MDFKDKIKDYKFSQKIKKQAVANKSFMTAIVSMLPAIFFVLMLFGIIVGFEYLFIKLTMYVTAIYIEEATTKHYVAGWVIGHVILNIIWPKSGKE